MGFLPTCGIVRAVSPTFSSAIVMNPGGERPSSELASRQHEQYVASLRDLGVNLIGLDFDGPDSCFVEDHALILKGVAVLLRVGHPDRLAESAEVHGALAKALPTVSLCEGTVDGGDVLTLGDTVFVGRSSRTNELGIRCLRKLVGAFDLRVVEVDVAGVLHLKSAVSALGVEHVLVAGRSVDPRVFERVAVVALVSDEEAYAANTLTIGRKTLVPEGFPKTAKQITDLGFEPLVLPMSEFQKADGALTCLSLLW